MSSNQENQKITPRSQDYAQWYQDIVSSADLAEHSSVKGCMVIKPYGYAIWENIQRLLDLEFKKIGIKNAYFPLLIPEKFLKKEAEHVEGFSPELVTVTHVGGKKLQEPLVIRPTSETIIYDTYSKWIKTHKDLPLLINQWANIVRWEKRPRLFLRTTEFLWQEGHTAHRDKKEADKFARKMLNVYQTFDKDVLAIPVYTGVKSDGEKFAGAAKTYTTEAMMQDGKSLQFGTSHLLGDNFAKVFNIKYTDEKGESHYVWQTSWGVSTRLVGGLIMAHSDDKGLVLPPNIAPIPVVIVPIWDNSKDEDNTLKLAKQLKEQLEKKNINVEIDNRDIRPGSKYYHWERRGVPLRIEIGPRDVESSSVMSVRRDTGEKTKLPFNQAVEKIQELLVKIQDSLLQQAQKRRDDNTIEVDNWEDFQKAIKENKFVIAPWKEDSKLEEKIKQDTKATLRCYFLDQKEGKYTSILSKKPCSQKALFAKNY